MIEITCDKKAEGFATTFMLEVEITVDAKKPAHKVVEPSVVRRADMLLDISRIGIVQSITLNPARNWKRLPRNLKSNGY